MGLLENKVGENQSVSFNKRNLRFLDNFEIFDYIFNVGSKSNLSPKNFTLGVLLSYLHIQISEKITIHIFEVLATPKCSSV